MPPDVWGPIFWNTMHIVSLGYPAEPTEADKAGARAFFESLTVVLPCPVCREHYKQQLTKSSLDEAVKSKGQLIFWVWETHNAVNRMLGKTEITIDQFLENMKRMGARKCSPFRCDGNADGASMGGMVVSLAVGAAIGAGAFWCWRRYRA